MHFSPFCVGGLWWWGVSVSEAQHCLTTQEAACTPPPPNRTRTWWIQPCWEQQQAGGHRRGQLRSLGTHFTFSLPGLPTLLSAGGDGLTLAGAILKARNIFTVATQAGGKEDRRGEEEQRDRLSGGKPGKDSNERGKAHFVLLFDAPE